MTGTTLLQAYEGSRGYTRKLADEDVLSLLSRLATEYLVRKNGSDEAMADLAKAFQVGLGVGRTVVDAQRELLGGASILR